MLAIFGLQYFSMEIKRHLKPNEQNIFSVTWTLMLGDARSVKITKSGGKYSKHFDGLSDTI